jgi:uncharacterized protein
MKTAAVAHRRNCPPDGAALVDALVRHIIGEPWLTDALNVVPASGLPDAWIGAGVIRDVVWGHLNGGFDPAMVNDVDVAFFDADDLSTQRDKVATRRLTKLLDRPWEASNQAAVHTWYHRYFGGPPVPPFASVHEAVATWPETATCVAVRMNGHGVEVCAPHGLRDLLAGVWRRNPARVSIDVSRSRLARIRTRWPAITVVPLVIASGQLRP